MFTLGALVSAVGSIYTGVTTLKSSNNQAEAYEYQGRIALDESLRDASIIREEGRNFAASQSLQFIGSGVHLVGSALITMEQTIKYAEAEAKATEAKGVAKANLAQDQADVKRSEGRAALVGGIINAGSSFIPAKA